MKLKLLWSTLSLLAISALFTDGAIAQQADASTGAAAKAKFANDYNAGKFKDVSPTPKSCARSARWTPSTN